MRDITEKTGRKPSEVDRRGIKPFNNFVMTGNLVVGSDDFNSKLKVGILSYNLYTVDIPYIDGLANSLINNFSGETVSQLKMRLLSGNMPEGYEVDDIKILTKMFITSAI